MSADEGGGSDARVPRGPLIELALGAAWLVGLAAALSIVEQLLGPGSLGAAILGAVGIDLLTGRAGVRWDREGARVPLREATRRAAAGVLVALGAGGMVIAVAGGLGWFVGHGAQPSSALAFAAARAIALAVRDELLLRGVPLTAAARARVPRPIAQGFAGLVSGASIAMTPGMTPAALALEVGSGWFFAALWERDRGAWGAIGAHAAWSLLLGSVLHGGLFDLDWRSGDLVTGAHASGAPAWLAAAVLAVGGLLTPRLPWPIGRSQRGGA